MTQYYDLNAFKAAVRAYLEQTETCTCDAPCCEVDIGVGLINCGAQHCPKHGCAENQGVPSYTPYEQAMYTRDHVNGVPIGEHTYKENEDYR